MIGKYAVKSILFFKEDSLNDAWKAYRFSDRLVNDWLPVWLIRRCSVIRLSVAVGPGNAKQLALGYLSWGDYMRCRGMRGSGVNSVGDGSAAVSMTKVCGGLARVQRGRVTSLLCFSVRKKLCFRIWTTTYAPLTGKKSLSKPSTLVWSFSRYQWGSRRTRFYRVWNTDKIPLLAFTVWVPSLINYPPHDINTTTNHMFQLRQNKSQHQNKAFVSPGGNTGQINFSCFALVKSIRVAMTARMTHKGIFSPIFSWLDKDFLRHFKLWNTSFHALKNRLIH